MPARAFNFFQRKAPQTVTVKEAVLIEGKFANNFASERSKLNPTAALELRLAIHMPRDQKYLTITTLYDEINENPIEQITWVVDQGKKKPPTKIKAYKIDQIINQKIESIALEYNPTLAYDRINDNKHIINKTFYYDKTAIFTDISQKPKLFLELYIPASKGSKTKSIRIDEQIYEMTPQQTNLKQTAPKQETPKKIPLTQAAPSQANIEVDADLEYAKQQLNNFNSGNANSPNINSPEQQQLQQMQQQMQLDGLGDEYGEDEESDEF